MMNQPPPVMPSQPPAPPSNAPFPTPEDLAQIQQDTGYSPQRIMQDVQKTGAVDKASLYPQFYGEGNPGIQPDAAAIGAGYGEPDGDEAMAPSGPGLEDKNEPPQRIAARQAMSGEQAAPMQPPAAPEEESALGAGALNRKPFNVHDRARRMKARPY